MTRATLTIDLDSIAANWRSLDALTSSSVETAAVVKADAYGLGAGPVARCLQTAGARTFFVANCDEGAELRSALGSSPAICVFTGMMRGDEELVREYRLTPCLASVEQILAFQLHTPNGNCALQIDTGMNRLGLEENEFSAVSDTITTLRPKLVMSHLADADIPDSPLNSTQRTEFDKMTRELGNMRKSLAATGGMLLGSEYHFDMTRPGIGLYGGQPFTEAQSVVTLSLPVIQVRDVSSGETVGYGATWRAQTPHRIATVSAGYADGLMRALSSGSVCLYAGNVPCPLVGRISMDLITVDVTRLKNVPGHLEILNCHQSIDDLAHAAGTIGYEILTSLGGRFERLYKGEGT